MAAITGSDKADNTKKWAVKDKMVLKMVFLDVELYNENKLL